MSLTYNEAKKTGKKGFEDLFSQIVKKGFCVGCGSCAGICPYSALKMEETKNGLYIPVVNKNSCQLCGLCLDICPSKYMPFPSTRHTDSPSSNDIEKKLLGAFKEVYIGYAKDKQVRLRGSSGGIVSSILIYALENNKIDGAVVVGMNENRPWMPQVKIATTKEEILEASGSKYSIVPLNSILQLIRKLSDRFAFVGLPCHIRGLRMIQQHALETISKKIAFNIGLFCGLNFRTTATTFLLSKMGIRNLKAIQKLEYRHGYPGGFYVKLANKELYSPGAGALLNLFRSEACTFCNDLTNELADISIGDIYRAHSKDAIGVTLTRTKKGENIFLQAKSLGYLKAHKIRETEVVESQLTGLLYKKRGSLVRKYMMDGKQPTPSLLCDNCVSESVPSPKQLIFETVQHKILFEEINKFLVTVSKYLPLWLVSFVYTKILIFLFLLGRFCYEK